MVLQQGYSPSQIHRFAALAETITWTLLALGMVLKYSEVTEKVLPFTGSLHGFGFLCFLLITVALWINNSWSISWGLAGLVVSVIPWGAYPFMLLAKRSGKLSGSWRFTGDSTPTTLPEKTLAQFFHHPARSLLIALVTVAVVFGLLLHLGPPVDVETLIRG